MAVLQRCGLASQQQRAPSSASAVVDGALSVVVGGQWPLAAATAAAMQPLRSFEGIFEALARSPEPAISSASRDPLHQVLMG